ncbi:MAG TPA: cytochrome c oxidase accessory protein CcoG, partial [Methylophilaceae bacterium]|nr:cytochrome c oxidase accessory protein CcoG [Methylophilaceae bacterium]
QDLIYLSFLLIVSALSLFLFTAVAGRLWCGYTCPQTVYTEIFLWIENKIEGDRNVRIKLDQSSLSPHKVFRKTLKHSVWIVFALWTGFTFVGYFTPIRELFVSLTHFKLSSWETFWICFYGFATYGNAGFMREQVCKYMCPYARFQSAMFDKDTLIVTYDEVRGEPRGVRSKKAGENKSLGACVDCHLCVQVCPTGIDIRKGLQYECIGCGLCADACDVMMDKMGYERGLIKYSTQNGMTNRWSRQQMIQRVLRPRVFIYAGVLTTLIVGLAISLYLKPSYRVDVMRDRAVIARITDDNMIENVYRIKIMNNAEEAQRFKIQATGDSQLNVEFEETGLAPIDKAEKLLMLEAGETKTMIIEIKVPDSVLRAGSYPIAFNVKSLSSQEATTEKSAFIVTN